jgi:hypothetical protein
MIRSTPPASQKTGRVFGGRVPQLSFSETNGNCFTVLIIMGYSIKSGFMRPGIPAGLYPDLRILCWFRKKSVLPFSGISTLWGLRETTVE